MNGTDMVVTDVNLSATAEALTVPINGAVGVICNVSDYCMINFIENKTTATFTYTTTSNRHVSFIYSRLNTSLDLNTVGLNIITDDDKNVVLDDVSPTDTGAALLILNKTFGDLDAIYEKYSD